MKIECPNCGELVVIHGLGRKPLDIGVIKVYDALQRYRSVKAAADGLGCSRGYIYKVLKAEGLTVQEVINVNKK